MSTTTTGTTRTQGRVTLPGVGRDIENVLLWRDIRVSGAIFTAGTILYFLLEWSGYSLLTLISNALLAILALAFLWNNVARFTGKTQQSPAFSKPVNESDVKQLAQQLTIFFNKSLAFGNRLISGSDVVLTGEVAVALYITSKVGRYFSSLGLVYTLFVLVFTLPKLYEWKKDDIDSTVSSTYQQGHALYHQNVKPYISSIPRASGASGVSSGTTSGTTQPTAAGRAQGLTSDTATSGPSATLAPKSGSGGGVTGGAGVGNSAVNQYAGSGNTGGNTGAQYGSQYGSGQGGYDAGTGTGRGTGGGQQGGVVESLRDTFNQPQRNTGYGGQSGGGIGGSGLGGSGGSGGSGTYNESGFGGQGTGYGGQGAGANQSYTDAARDTVNQLGNKASDLGNQAYQNLPSSRSNY